MEKRGQITFFLILGIFIVGMTVFYLNFASNNPSNTTPSVTQSLGDLDESVFKNFLTSCLTSSGEASLWLMGFQGGYLNAQDFNLYNTISYGKGLAVPYWVPIYANAAAHAKIATDSTGAQIQMPLSYTLPGTAKTWYVREATSAFPTPMQTNPSTGKPWQLTDTPINTQEAWTAQVIPALEQMEIQWQKATLVKFEECVEKGMTTFEDYAEIDYPTKKDGSNNPLHPTYITTRDAYLDSNKFEDFTFTGLPYTGSSIKLEASFNENDVLLTLNYPIVAKDKTKVVKVTKLSAGYDVGIKRLHTAAKTLVEQTIVANRRPIGTDPTAPGNVYGFTTAECAKYEGTAYASLPLNGKTNIYVSVIRDLDEVLTSLDTTNQKLCPFTAKTSGGGVNIQALSTNAKCQQWLGDLGAIRTKVLTGTATKTFSEYQLVRLVDSRPKELKYNTPFVYQFALKNLNVKGKCPP